MAEKPSLKIFITDPAKRDLMLLDKKMRERIEDALERLVIHPNQVDLRKLEGKKDYWRVRV